MVASFGTGMGALYLAQASGASCALQHGSVGWPLPVPLRLVPLGAEAAAQHCCRLVLPCLWVSEEPHEPSQVPGLCCDTGVFLQE